MCSINGSTPAPSSATTKGARCAISPPMKRTSRDNRSSLATSTWPLAPCGGQRRGALRPAVERIGPLPRLHLDQLHAVLGGENSAVLPLGIQSEPGPALAFGGHAAIGDDGLHLAATLVLIWPL